MKNFRFCPRCKDELTKVNKDGDRYVACPSCDWRHYDNPLPSVAVFALNDDNEILLIRRGEEPGRGAWALSSGFIEQDELPEETAIRELREETGLKGTSPELIGAYIEPTRIYGTVLLLGYAVRLAGGKLRPGSDASAAKFFPLNRLPRIPFESHRRIIADRMRSMVNQSLLITCLKSKITEARVTRTVLHYRGSMGIDAAVMQAAGLFPGEKVQVLNYDNGERLETYTIPEKKNSGRFVLYGPASLKGKKGHKLCILSYALSTPLAARSIKPRVVILGNGNSIKKIKRS